jgi:hypothetical protein
MTKDEEENMYALLEYLLEDENLFDDWSRCRVSTEYVVNKFKNSTYYTDKYDKG